MGFLNSFVPIEDLFFRVRWVRKWETNESWSIRNHVLPYTIFWLVLSGTMEVKLNQVCYQLRPYDLLVIPPGTDYSASLTLDGEPLSYLALGCEASLMSLDIVRLYQFPQVTSMEVNNLKPIRKLASTWIRLTHRFSQLAGIYKPEQDIAYMSTHHVSTIQSIAYLQFASLSLQWLSEVLQAIQVHLSSVPLPIEARVKEVCNYITHHLADHLMLDDLAAQVHLSPGHLRALFQQSLHLSPMAYVRLVRLQTARKWLLTTSLSLKEMASRLGYFDQSHFSRVFTEAEGVSPHTYRKRITEEHLLL